jgi:hypothetical protein
MGLFEVAILSVPTKEEEEQGKMEEIILRPTPIIAKSDNDAYVQTVIEHKDIIAKMPKERVKILVSFFG